MPKKIRVRYRKLGKENAYGMADDKKRIIDIDERLTGKKQLEILIHEADHIICPEWSEEKVKSHSKELAEVLWSQGFRKIV